jgi:A/G-specific adenine glycosylase
MDSEAKKEFVKTILCWWEKNRRDLPWRHTKEPYLTLITEILLRKTTATHVNSIYQKFFEKYPTIQKLAGCEKKELKNIITPLGLAEQRSEQLIKLAKTVIADYNGKIPEKRSDLLKLPGVGNYTAAAVSCISYGQDTSTVDTNFVRVIGRFFNFKSEKKSVYMDKKLWDFVTGMIPKGKCKEFNLGLIDFASAVCIPKNPRCSECNMKECCIYFNKQV